MAMPPALRRYWARHGRPQRRRRRARRSVEIIRVQRRRSPARRRRHHTTRHSSRKRERGLVAGIAASPLMTALGGGAAVAWAVHNPDVVTALKKIPILNSSPNTALAVAGLALGLDRFLWRNRLLRAAGLVALGVGAFQWMTARINDVPNAGVTGVEDDTGDVAIG